MMHISAQGSCFPFECRGRAANTFPGASGGWGWGSSWEFPGGEGMSHSILHRSRIHPPPSAGIWWELPQKPWSWDLEVVGKQSLVDENQRILGWFGLGRSFNDQLLQFHGQGQLQAGQAALSNLIFNISSSSTFHTILGNCSSAKQFFLIPSLNLASSNFNLNH